MAAPTNDEQFFLELVNEARLDPLGSAARFISSYAPVTSSNDDIRSALNFFGVSGAALQTAFVALAPVGALAWNNALGAAADKHNAAMIASDQQSHQLPGEADLGTRLGAEGYSWSTAGENVFAYSLSTLYGHAGLMIDWGVGPNGMQSPAGHRANIMRSAYREIGIAVSAPTDFMAEVGPQIITQDFGARDQRYFVLGVAYSDTNANRFYSVGEGRGELVVQAGGEAVTSAASGGYSLPTAQGATTVMMHGGGLVDVVVVSVTIGAENLKLDVVNGDTLLTSGSLAITNGAIASLRGLGARGLSLAAGAGDQLVEGTPGNDRLTGGPGDDTLRGNGGADVAVYSGNRSDYYVTVEGEGFRLIDLRPAGDGSDLAIDIDTFRFADGDRSAAFLSTSPLPVAAQYHLIAPSGWEGAVKGNGEVSGTNGFQDLAFLEGWGAIVLDGSFARGGDLLRLPDVAASYTIALVGSSALISSGADQLTAPVGLDGMVIAFADGARELSFDLASLTPKIGSQTISSSAAAIAALPDDLSIPIGRDTSAFARLLVADNGQVEFKGNTAVFGSNGNQTLTPLSGIVNLDASFARGGDTLLLPAGASNYRAYVAGSQIVLVNGGDEIHIPVGIAGMTLDFSGDSRTLVYDLADASIEIAGQEVSATSLGTAMLLA